MKRFEVGALIFSTITVLAWYGGTHAGVAPTSARDGARRRRRIPGFFGYVRPKWRTPAMNIITVGDDRAARRVVLTGDGDGAD